MIEMKRIYYVFTVIAAASIAVSCGDFLERAPGDNMTKEELFSKIETAERYLDNAYVYLPDFQCNTEDLTDSAALQTKSAFSKLPVIRHRLSTSTSEAGTRPRCRWHATGATSTAALGAAICSSRIMT